MDYQQFVDEVLRLYHKNNLPVNAIAARLKADVKDVKAIIRNDFGSPDTEADEY